MATLSIHSRTLILGSQLSSPPAASAGAGTFVPTSLSVSGTLTASTGSVSGGFTAASLSAVAGSFSGGLAVGGTITGAALSVTGAFASVTGNLGVLGAGSVSGGVTVGGTLTVGVASVTGTLTAGAASVTGSLTVGGNLQCAGYVSASNLGAFRNRIINGDMAIDQRNSGNGTVTTGPTGSTFVLDRWAYYSVGVGALAISRIASTVSGLPYALQGTLTTAFSYASAGNVAHLYQPIEGNMMSDMAWGSAAAQAVTMSFWVNSTSAGNVAVAVRNANFDRSYVTTVNLPTANTWYYRSVTIPGETTGVWGTGTNRFGDVNFALGAGTGTYMAPSTNTWLAGGYVQASGANNLTAAGAALRITGVQLEKGPLATPFEFRPLPAELQLCKRYYNRISSSSSDYGGVGTGHFLTTTAVLVTVALDTELRAAATVSTNADNTTYVIEGQVNNTTFVRLSAVSVFLTGTTRTQLLNFTSNTSITTGTTAAFYCHKNFPGTWVAFTAEL